MSETEPNPLRDYDKTRIVHAFEGDTFSLVFEPDDLPQRTQPLLDRRTRQFPGHDAEPGIDIVGLSSAVRVSR